MMNVTNRCTNYNQRPAFKGYDARPLKAVVMTISDDPNALGVIKEMADIGEKSGFSVFFSKGGDYLYKNFKSIQKAFEEKLPIIKYNKWAQDRAVLTPKKEIITDGLESNNSFARKIRALSDGKIQETEDYIEGGNIFFVKNGDKNEMLLGAEDLPGRTVTGLQKAYGVDKVHILPQADYHLDLFYRPLNDKKILIADDRLTLKGIRKGISGAKKYLKAHPESNPETQAVKKVQEKLEDILKKFKEDKKLNHNFQADEIEPILKEKGFEPIRVPGRLYYTIPNYKRDDLVHSMNYINAVVHEKPDKTLTYITNKSSLNEDCGITPEIAKKIGFDFEEMFVQSLKPHIKKEDVHFVSGTKNHMAKLLEDEAGGIHCLCNEIPAELSR